MVEEMFDPNAYHSHIAALESSTEAIKIAAKQELGVKPRGDRQARYYTTSTLVSTALPTNVIVAHRRNLAGQSYPLVNAQLAGLASAPVRQTLLHAARSRPSPEQATADASKLVEAMIVAKTSAGGGGQQPVSGGVGAHARCSSVGGSSAGGGGRGAGGAGGSTGGAGSLGATRPVSKGSQQRSSAPSSRGSAAANRARP